MLAKKSLMISQLLSSGLHVLYQANSHEPVLELIWVISDDQMVEQERVQAFWGIDSPNCNFRVCSSNRNKNWSKTIK